jgi:hypothetical protein
MKNQTLFDFLQSFICMLKFPFLAAFTATFSNKARYVRNLFVILSLFLTINSAAISSAEINDAPPCVETVFEKQPFNESNVSTNIQVTSLRSIDITCPEVRTPSYSQQWKDENGEILRTLTVEYDPDNNLLIRRKFCIDNQTSEIVYFFDNDHQLIKIEKIDSDGNREICPYDSVDLMNQILLSSPIQHIFEPLTDNEKRTIQNNPSSRSTSTWSTFWESTEVARAAVMNQLKSAAHFLNDTRHKLSLMEQMKSPIDRIVHQLFSTGFLQFCGYYQEQASSGCTTFGTEIGDKVRVTFINGLLNIHSDMQTSIKTLSDTHGGVKIHYVFRPTEGWTKDLLASTLSKLGLVSIQAQLLAEKWRALIREMGGIHGNGRIVHYAHSIGATDTYIAKELLAAQEQRMIHVVTLGSPSLIMDDAGFATVQHYVSKRDGVSMIVDPIGYLSGLLSANANISLIGSYWGIPFIDHTLFTETYYSIIETLGKEFIMQYSDKDM